jgi:hypothetical protein
MNADAAEKPPILGYKYLSSARYDYRFECPVGVWTARLDMKAWGKKRNLLLYFSERGTDAPYAISVFWTTGYSGEHGAVNFKSDAEPGEMFQLETAKTRTGTIKLVRAIKLQPWVD